MPQNSQLKTADPTFNVRELVDFATKRIDDLTEVRTKQVDDKIKDKDVQYQLQFNSAKEAVSIALIAQEKAVAAALEGTKEAINKADINTDKRFSLLSEKIDGITVTMNKSTGERGIYVTHSDLSTEMEKLRNSFEAMLRPVVNFMNSQTGKIDESQNIWGYIVGGGGLIVAVMTLILYFNK